MKKSRNKLVALVIAAALATSPVTAFAQTLNEPAFSVRSASSYTPVTTDMVNGHLYPAIAVNGVTYLLWAALELFQTPYQYLGNGTFIVAGKLVQGVVYNGQSYIPWDSVGGTPINATRLGDGGWNFTRVFQDTATDGYKLNVILSDGTAAPGVFVPMWVQTFAANGKPVAGNISVTETTNVPGYGSGSMTNVPTPFYNPETLFAPGTETITVTWTDPNGQTHTIVKTLVFQYPQSTQTPIPSDETVVTTVPIHVVNDQVLLDIQSLDGHSFQMQLDTGAMAPLLSKQMADAMHLPNLGPLTVVGVTGNAKAYVTKFSFKLGGVQFNDVPAIVYDGYQGNPLFGYSFFDKNNYDLLVSNTHHTLTVLKRK